MRLVLALLPLIAFYVVESAYGLKPALIAAMALAVVDLGVGRWLDGRISRMTAFGAALVLGLGGMSLLSDDERFVLWTPVIGDVVFAGVMLGGLLLSESPLEIAVREQDPDAALDPWMRGRIRGLTARFALVLLVHAGLAAWSTGQPRETWLFVTGPVQYALIGLQVAGEAAWARFGPAPPPLSG